PDITLVVAMYSPDDSREPLYMSNYATLQVKDQLSRLPGVGDMNVFGARDYSMRLWLDPDKVAARGMTAGDILASIREQNIQVAAGTVGGPPLPNATTQFQYTVSAQGRLTAPEQFGEIVVKVGEDGQITRLSDIGRVELGAAEYATSITFNGKPAVGIAIFQLPGSNAIETANAVYKRMEELKTRFPQGLDYSIPYDTTIFVRDSIRDVVKTLLEGILLVVIVVLAFLQNWRAAVVPLLAIPVSLIGTFAVMWAFGFSMNNLSLFGLVLAIGIVVDDAIVVVENVERWIEEGMAPRDAARRAMDEVTPAVIAIAFGLSAVFIPVAFMSGITGQFYRQFALTISFSTLISAFNSLTLSPALAALLLRPRGESQDWMTRFLDRSLGWFFRLFNRAFDSTNRAYIRGLRRVVRMMAVSLFVYVGLIGLAAVAFRTVPTGFIPPQDQGYLLVNVQMPDASAMDRTQAAMSRFSEAARSVKGVRAVFAVSGLSILTRSNSSSAGVMFVNLNYFSDRAGDDELSASAISKRLTTAFAEVQDATAFVIPPPPVRGIGTAGGFKLQVQDRSGQGSPQDLQRAIESVLIEARKRPELGNVFSSYRSSQPQLYADIDRVKAKQQNVPLTNIFETLQLYLGGVYVNDFNYLGRTWRVMAQADAPFRATAADVGTLQTRNENGEMVPLAAVMELRDTTGPDRIQRYNL
ncbi:MAG: efflux RND transporter permease subunit, partial [Deltaproteobacteria bacterium]|nr:efflux RND transporter permease subunit [Deltaproteobacteria bacterium]